MSEFSDKSGKPLTPGDLVVYAVMLGRSSALAYGKVLAITDNGKLRVRRVDTRWSIPGAGPKPTPRQKTSLLNYGDRVLLIQRDQVPPEYLPVFDAIRPLDGGTFEDEE